MRNTLKPGHSDCERIISFDEIVTTLNYSTPNFDYLFIYS